MNSQLSIALILGTGREGRMSEKVARYVEAQAITYGFAVQFVDVRTYVSPVTVPPEVDRKTMQPWKAVAAACDGFLIVTPEYNHGYPGELKILLDSLRSECARKPVALCGVSKGVYGGARVVENLLPVLIDLAMNPIRTAVYFTNARELFDEHGAIKDLSYEAKLKKLFDELAWYAGALKAARAPI